MSDLPRCQVGNCGGLLRPNVVLFGEDLDEEVMDAAHEELENCDLCLVVGTSSVVYPAAMFAPQVNYSVSHILPHIVHFNSPDFSRWP